VDITTAYSGSPTEFPRPPDGVKVRRLTHSWAGGTVRGTPEGDRIAYYGKGEGGTTQIFIIPSDGSDRHPDPAKRPVQATHLPQGVEGGLRWHPSGEYIAYISNGDVAVTCIRPGPDFGRTRFLIPQGEGSHRYALVWSPDGKFLAYNRKVPTFDSEGRRVYDCNGEDLSQIFVVEFHGLDQD